MCVCMLRVWISFFGRGHICGLTTLLRLQDFEAQVWEKKQKKTVLSDPPFPLFTLQLKHKTQLLRELILP